MHGYNLRTGRIVWPGRTQIRPTKADMTTREIDDCFRLDGTLHESWIGLPSMETLARIEEFTKATGVDESVAVSEYIYRAYGERAGTPLPEDKANLIREAIRNQTDGWGPASLERYRPLAYLAGGTL